MKIQLPGDTGLEVGSEEYNALAKFINFIIPGIIDKSGIEQDNAKYERWKNMQRLLEEAKSITSGSELIQPPLKIAEPILEYGSLESEPSLQSKWANLLANSIKGRDIKTSYSEILKELSSIEVRILDRIYEDISLQIKKDSGKITDMQIDTQSVVRIFNIELDKMYEIIDNLKRLNLIEAPAAQGIQMGGFLPTGHTRDAFQITFLGIAFIKSCRVD